MKEVSPGRHVLRDSGVCFSMFPSRARNPAKSQHSWPLSCGPLWQHAQRNSREASLSLMFGNLRLLRGHRLATNTCNSCSSIPTTSLASLTPVVFLTFPDKRQTPPGVISFTSTEAHIFLWPLSSQSGERSLRPVSCLASWIIVVYSFDGTCSLPHNANLRAPSRTLRTWSVS